MRGRQLASLLRPRLARLSPRTLYTAQQLDRPVVVVGVTASQEHEQQFSLTETGEQINTKTGGQLAARLAASGPLLKAGNSRLLGSLHPDLGPVVAVGLGAGARLEDAEEGLDHGREAVRAAAAAGVRAAAALQASRVELEGLGDSEAAAEGAWLANWQYNQFKKVKKPLPEVGLMDGGGCANGWDRGLLLAGAQNTARRLMEAPANFLTPQQFCLEAERELSGLAGVEVEVRDEAWAKQLGMGAFLSVTRGSAEPAKFLECTYRGAEEDSAPLVLVGKGVTFDTGGISIKPAGKMDAMRADMGGAATVLASLKAVAALRLKVNLTVLIPLCENMPGGAATKPGDVVTAMNGTTIQVDNTDAEGRLILADALCYADRLSPRLVMDVATLTGAMSVALGSAATGVFATRTEDWAALELAGRQTGDRVWRMPLWQTYRKKMENSPLADLNNISLTPGGGSCTAAAFLSVFTTCPAWLHLDIAGVMSNEGEVAYLGKGMSGRPTRTIVNFVQSLQTN